MEEILKESLHEGEKLLWTSKPEEFTTLDLSHKSYFVRKTIISVAVAIALAALYMFYASSNGVDIKIGVVIAVLACGVFIPCTLFTDASKLRKSVLYAATDSRLIVVRDGINSVEYSRITSASFKMDADGHTSLLCGKRALKAAPTKWRAFTLMAQPFEEGDIPCDSFVFYALPDADELKSVLKNHLPALI